MVLLWSAPDAIKMVEAVASMEVVEASGSNEADVDVRFDLADWKLEMGENDNDDQSEGENFDSHQTHHRSICSFEAVVNSPTKAMKNGFKVHLSAKF